MVAFILYLLAAFIFTVFFQVLEKHHPKVWFGGFYQEEEPDWAFFGVAIMLLPVLLIGEIFGWSYTFLKWFFEKLVG